MREPDHVDVYGAHPDQLIELYRGDGMRGLVVLLHGGFWRSRWDRTHLRPMAVALAEAGWAVALPEFRRVGGGGGWPHTFDDVRRIVAAAPELVRERFGAGSVSRVVLAGHSAGGHLAVWSQAASGSAAVASVDHVVSLAGVLDLAEAHRLALSGDAVGELLGGPSEPGFIDRLAAADPMTLPVPDGPTLALVHGEDDDEVPASFSRVYADRDPRIRFTPLAAAGHYELIDPATAVWPSVLAALEAPGRRGDAH
ncbi:alpha/beta hydrolase [Herbiconiux moechotypicola]|uniref:Alpha/beta hydrolase n=1 Tax=Herbiconiux moechotypicola TaxID=637393 RepID=A0ABN3E063_9MICO|nr:alpha/beta hydrolase [Herbiconiux moechotypicola]MCS5731119.1 alpha/beta hydrolase [Herbiconiux moechotypicola]